MAAVPESPFLRLPAELIQHILSFLGLSDLLRVALVNRALQEHSLQDTLYQPFVQAQVPGHTVSKPPDSSWRHLYQLHYPYWFVSQQRIWFADTAHTGKLIVARYDHRINAIEAYALVAERRQPTLQPWGLNPDVLIHTFNPHVQLDLNTPALKLDKDAYENARGIGRRLQSDVRMDLSTDRIHAQFLTTRPWPADITTEGTPVWPPLTLPSTSRCRTDSPSNFHDTGNRPSLISDLSTSTFRIRKWVHFGGNSGPGGGRVYAHGDVSTWGTLPPECYTPTAKKPWQGIWCGDYAGHGCEFLVIMQPDDPKPLPAKAEWVLRAREREGSMSSNDSWTTAHTGSASEGEDAQMTDLEESCSTIQDLTSATSSSTEEHVAEEDSAYQGRIEAVKLTGDPNVPRGQYTFIAPDIGPKGLIRVAREQPFEGARIVESVGHIAMRNFRDDDYMRSQLIIISHDRLALFWETFGHVSFFQRVNLDELTNLG